MTAPVVEAVDPAAEDTVEILDDTSPEEWPVRFPVLVIEGLDTSDGRYIEPEALTHRALPLSLLAQAEAPHGGEDVGPAIVVGRIDTLTRTPGAEVISKRTGEPFPEGTFIWSGTGAVDPTIEVAPGRTIGNLIRRRFLRGISADLVGMDYDILGMPMSEDDPGLPVDPENPRRELVTHSAELAAATIVPVPAFGDAYMELDDEPEPAEQVDVEDLPDDLVASAFPAWRSAEVGDYQALPITAAGEFEPTVGNRMVARIPENAVDQFTQVIDSGEERDAVELATALVQHIADNWAADVEDDPDDELAPGYEPPAVVAAADDGPHTGGMIALVPADPDALAVDGGDPSDQLHLTLAYLGEDVTGWDDQRRTGTLAAVESAAALVDAPIEARVFAHAIFNPDGYQDRDPATVYLVGETPQTVADLRARTMELADVEQHEPFAPHITAGCNLPVDALTFTGSVRFDRLRVALGEDVTDIPLGEPADVEEEPAREPEEIAAAAQASPVSHEPARQESAVTAAAPVRPPAVWFADPKLDGPTALRVTEEGHVYGHAALWDTVHIGQPNARIRPPRSTTGYAYYRTGAVLCDDGSEVAVGPITIDCGHAGTDLGRMATVRHYDDVGTAVADCAVGEDQWGIWVAGALRPTVDEVTVARLRASSLSGDWRRVGSSLELCALLAVNVPGFPIPRARVASGEPLALVAAGALRPADSPETMRVTVGDQDVWFSDAASTALADAIADALDRRRHAGELSARHTDLVAELDDTPAVVAALLKEVDDSPQRAAALLAELDEPAGISLDG